MTDTDQVPDLAGGVDLASPIQQAGRNFLATMAQNDGRAMAMVGITVSGQVLMASFAPGGIVEVLGILEMAKMAVAQKQQGNG